MSVPAIVAAAAAAADRRGLAGLSMRSVGKELGVEAMSLYHHVANKDALLDQLTDWVFAQITLPGIGEPWRRAMHLRAASAREVLAAHPWALHLVESRRSPGPALLRHHDTVLGCLLADGFSMAMAVHAFSVIDSYVYGFVLTEQNLPFEPGEDASAFAAGLDFPTQEYPHLARLVAGSVMQHGYDYATEFMAGLEMILDGVERQHLESGSDQIAPTPDVEIGRSASSQQ